MPLAQLVTLILCTAIGVGTLAGLLGGLRQAVRVVRETARIRALAAHAQQEDGWESLDATARASTLFATAWPPYAAATHVAADGRRTATTPPETWLRPHLLHAGPWSDAQVARLSGLLVSLGILGTFLGLTLGLVDANFSGIQALVEADARTEALQSAMFGLLAGSSTAFVTSVAGLGGSLLVTFGVRVIGARSVDGALTQLWQTLHAQVPVEPVEATWMRAMLSAQPSIDTERIVSAIAALAPPIMPVSVVEEPPDATNRSIQEQPPWLASLSDTLARLNAHLAAPASPSPEAALLEQLVARPTVDAQLLARLDDLRDALSPAPLPSAAPTPAPLSTEWGPLLRSNVTQPLQKSVEVQAEKTRAAVHAVLRELQRPSQTQTNSLPDPPSPPPWQTLEATLADLAQAVRAPPQAPAELLTLLNEIAATLAMPANPQPFAEAAAVAGAALADGLAPALQQATENTEGFAAASRTFDQATVRLDAAARSNHDAADVLRQASQDLGARLAGLQQATAALRTGLAHHTDASNALTTAAASLETLRPQLSRTTEQLRLSASSMESTTERLTAIQRASGGPEVARLVPLLEALLLALENRR